MAFAGEFGRVFHAFDTKTGKQHYGARACRSFAVGGKQYIAVLMGLGGGSPEEKPTFPLDKEVTRPAQGAGISDSGQPAQ